MAISEAEGVCYHVEEIAESEGRQRTHDATEGISQLYKQ